MSDPRPSDSSAPLAYRPRQPRPWWVRAGLAGVPSRGAAVAWCWGCVALSLAGVAAGVTGVWWAWLGAPLVLAAGWYLACVRWVDRNDQWG